MSDDVRGAIRCEIRLKKRSTALAAGDMLYQRETSSRGGLARAPIAQLKRAVTESDDTLRGSTDYYDRDYQKAEGSFHVCLSSKPNATDVTFE